MNHEQSISALIQLLERYEDYVATHLTKMQIEADRLAFSQLILDVLKGHDLTDMLVIDRIRKAQRTIEFAEKVGYENLDKVIPLVRRK